MERADVRVALIDEAVGEFANGKPVVVVDDQDRENEGDLIAPAEMVTAEQIAFMVRYTSGIICVPMLPARLNALRIAPMTTNNTESMSTAFTVSVDCKHGTTTGVSAADRARTIRALVDPASRAEDFTQPGHVFPLMYREGGVLRRTGHTEAAVDLARLAGLQPAGVLAELVSDDGSMMRLPELARFADRHDLKLISIAELVAFRRAKETLIRRLSEESLATGLGTFRVVSYEWAPDGTRAFAFVVGNVAQRRDVLVRVHRGCVAGDLFGATACSCGAVLKKALQAVQSAGLGVVLYLWSELRGGQRLQQRCPSPEAVDERDVGIGAQILRDLGLEGVRLLTSGSASDPALRGHGVRILDRVPLSVDRARPWSK